MKTIEVKLAETEEEVAAGGWKQMAMINVTAPVRAHGAVVDGMYAGSVLIFTNNTALQAVVEQALRAHEKSIGASTGNPIGSVMKRYM